MIKKTNKEIESNTLNVYNQSASVFDQERNKSLFEKKWLDKLLSKLSKNDSLLDIGCGSGEPIANYFIKNGIIVTGLDFSSEMIKIAQRRFPNNKWIVQDMRDLNLDSTYNAIIAWNSFFHLNPQDQMNVISKFSQHVRDGGFLLMTIGPENGEAIGSVNGMEVYHSSFNQAEYEQILNENGFKLLEYKANDHECQKHSILLAQKI